MYIVRDTFHLKFGQYKDVKALLDEGAKMGMFKENSARILTDFTGDSYRLILEQSYKSLADYEQIMAGNTGRPEWGQWYMQFRTHIETSHREILKHIM